LRQEHLNGKSQAAVQAERTVRETAAWPPQCTANLRGSIRLPVETSSPNPIEFLVKAGDFSGTRTILFEIAIGQAPFTSQGFDLKFN
jgi:hypothetical protein